MTTSPHPTPLAPPPPAQSLVNFPKEAINDETVELLQPYFAAPDFNYESAKKASGNVAGLCNWAASMCKYHEVAKVGGSVAVDGEQVPQSRQGGWLCGNGGSEGFLWGPSGVDKCVDQCGAMWCRLAVASPCPVVHAATQVGCGITLPTDPWALPSCSLGGGTQDCQAA